MLQVATRAIASKQINMRTSSVPCAALLDLCNVELKQVVQPCKQLLPGLAHHANLKRGWFVDK
jgi:hypothetical protein